MSRRRVALAWSSGKDSAWSLHRLRSIPDLEVTTLLTTVDGSRDQIPMHRVPRRLLHAQAEATGLDLLEVPIPFPCSNQEYEQAMSGGIDELLARGVDAVAFGDLFLEDVRRYRMDNLRGTGIEPLFPLWGADTAHLAEEMLSAGLEALITTLDPQRIDSSWVGRSYDRRLLTGLPEGVDPCGENGEFHTFVTDGPMFDRPITVECGEVYEADGLISTVLRAADGAPS